jgi:putative copper resistance protein D
MRVLYLVSVWLHILAAATWLGGLLFFVTVVMPVLRRPEHRAAMPSLLEAIALRLRWLGWALLAVLVLSGLVNASLRGLSLAQFWDPETWQSPFGRTLLEKMVVVALMIGVSLWHDVLLGPRAIALMRKDPGSLETRRLRRLSRWAGGIVVLLSLFVFLLSVILVRGRP